jgi:branched-chain amino acid transport system substrate-binding protein
MTVRALLVASALSLALVAPSCGSDSGGSGTIRIGVLADCEGIFGFSSTPAYAGAELPLISRGARPLGPEPASGLSAAEVAGKKVKLFLGCGDDTAQKALSEARRLVEQVGVKMLIGPTQEGEAFVVRDYARKRPGVTFLDGTAAGQSLTLQDPARNFVRFSTDGAQWIAGLGRYAYRNLGWRKAVTIGPDEGFEYTQVAGFVAEFCALGGTVVKRLWGPQADVSDYITRNRADGFYVGDNTNFTTEFKNLRGSLAKRIVGGIFLGGSAGPLAPELARRLVGIVIATPGPSESTRPAWTEYLAGLHKTFPVAEPLASSIFPIAYYDAMEATLKALELVHGDLSGGERRFQAALAGVRLESPVGTIHLDRNRQAVGSNFLSRTEKGGNVRDIGVVPNVDETFGGYFHTNGPPPSRTYPPCKHGNPPPWARSG